jgi:hypothetical protein
VNSPDSDSHPGRLVASRALVVLASVAIMLALVVAYARQAAVDSDQFAHRATVALHDDSVRSLIAQQVTDELVLKNEEDLLAARPIIESVASEIVGGRAFTSLFRKAVRDLHRALFKRDPNTVTLTLTDVGTVLAAALEQVRPALADELQSTERVELVRSDIGSVSVTLADIAETVELLALFLLVLSLALVAGAIAIAPDRRQAVVELGVGAAVAGVVLVVAYSVARSIAVDHVEGPDEQAAARAVWQAFLGDLRTASWILAVSGAAVAAAAASLIKPAQFGEPLRVAANWVAREPRRPALRVLRGVAFVAAGIAVLVDRNGFSPCCSRSSSGSCTARRSTRRGSPSRRARGRSAGAGLPRRWPRPCSSLSSWRSSSAAAAPRRPRPRRDPATAAWSCASGASITSRCRPPTTRCPCRCRAGTRRSRSGRSSTS